MATAQAHSGVTDTTATIAVSGLAAPLKVLHLSDSHISLSSDNEPHSSRMHRAFYSDGAGRPHRTTGETQLPRDRFIQQVEEATANGTELLIHTGDFLNVRCLCSPIAPRWKHRLTCLTSTTTANASDGPAPARAPRLGPDTETDTY
jgi:hypothetical protein